MTFDEWFDTLPKFPSPDDVYFRHFMGKAWDAALKFAQQPQGEICHKCDGSGEASNPTYSCRLCNGTGKLSPRAADVVGNNSTRKEYI